MDPRYLDPNQSKQLYVKTLCTVLYSPSNNVLYMEQVNILFRVGRDILKHTNYLYYDCLHDALQNYPHLEYRFAHYTSDYGILHNTTSIKLTEYNK